MFDLLTNQARSLRSVILFMRTEYVTSQAIIQVSKLGAFAALMRTESVSLRRSSHVPPRCLMRMHFRPVSDIEVSVLSRNRGAHFSVAYSAEVCADEMRTEIKKVNDW